MSPVQNTSNKATSNNVQLGTHCAGALQQAANNVYRFPTTPTCCQAVHWVHSVLNHQLLLAHPGAVQIPCPTRQLGGLLLLLVLQLVLLLFVLSTASRCCFTALWEHMTTNHAATHTGNCFTCHSNSASLATLQEGASRQKHTKGLQGQQ
jgi:hypothetical protein